MIKKTFFAAALVAVASSAMADTQLERSLGIAAGTFSVSEIAKLKRAYENEDRHQIRHLMNSNGAGVVSTRGASGWDASGLSASERFVIATALEENRFHKAAFVEAGGLRSAAVGSDASKARLARELGVAADDYSFVELVNMKLRNERDDD